VESSGGNVFFSSSFCISSPVGMFYCRRFYAFIFGVGNNARSWRKSCGRLSAQMRILCLPQKVAERKENSAQKKKILFAIFPAAGIVTNDATAPFHRTKNFPNNNHKKNNCLAQNAHLIR